MKKNSIKSKTDKKKKGAPMLPMLPMLQTTRVINSENSGITPLLINNEREYLEKIKEETTLENLSTRLMQFGDTIYIPSILTQEEMRRLTDVFEAYKPRLNLPDVKGDNKNYGPRFNVYNKPKIGVKKLYKDIVKSILSNYKELNMLKYIIKLYLNQYSLTFEDFHDKFLKKPIVFKALKDVRKMFLDIVQHKQDEGIFERTLELDMVHNYFDEFSEEYKDYQNILADIKENFDLKETLNFIKEFLDQTHQYLDEFYDEFMSDPIIKMRLSKPAGIQVQMENPTLLQTVVSDKIAELSDDTQYKDSEFMYSIVPWLSNTVENVLIAKVDNDISDYIARKPGKSNKTTQVPPVNINGEDWYKVNNKYFKLQANPDYKKEQKGDVLNFIDNTTGKLFVNFKLAFEVYAAKKERGKINIVFQDEALFAKEIEYIHEKTASIPQKINEILQQDIKQDIKDNAINICKSYIKLQDEYIKTFINLLSTQSAKVEDFIVRLGNILIYFPIEINNFSYELFKTRTNTGFYTPDELVNLTPVEKLPEIYDLSLDLEGRNITNLTRDTITDYLNNKLREFVEDFVDHMYQIRNPYTSFKPRSQYIHRREAPRLKGILPDWRLEADNFIKKYDETFTRLKNDAKDTDEENVDINDLGKYMKYRENDKIYYFNILDAISRLKNENLTNPYTLQPLSEQFLDSLRNLRIKIPENIKEKIPDIVVTESMTPGLIQLLRIDINRMLENTTLENKLDNFDSKIKFNMKLDAEKILLENIEKEKIKPKKIPVKSEIKIEDVVKVPELFTKVDVPVKIELTDKISENPTLYEFIMYKFPTRIFTTTKNINIDDENSSEYKKQLPEEIIKILNNHTTLFKNDEQQKLLKWRKEIVEGKTQYKSGTIYKIIDKDNVEVLLEKGYNKPVIGTENIAEESKLGKFIPVDKVNPKDNIVGYVQIPNKTVTVNIKDVKYIKEDIPKKKDDDDISVYSDSGSSFKSDKDDDQISVKSNYSDGNFSVKTDYGDDKLSDYEDDKLSVKTDNGDDDKFSVKTDNGGGKSKDVKNCRRCKKPIKDTEYKSIEWNDECGNFNIVSFCCIDCIDDHEFRDCLVSNKFKTYSKDILKNKKRENKKNI